MHIRGKEITIAKALIALLAVFAVFAVLVSPAPDELPGTTPHLSLDALVFASIFLFAGGADQPLADLLAISWRLPFFLGDLLTLQCTRLC